MQLPAAGLPKFVRSLNSVWKEEVDIAAKFGEEDARRSVKEKTRRMQPDNIFVGLWLPG
jgi:hypothetical protein